MARTRITTYGPFGTTQEQIITGPRALSRYLSGFSWTIGITRYHDGPSKRRLTRRGAVEVVFTKQDGTTAMLVAQALRAS